MPIHCSYCANGILVYKLSPAIFLPLLCRGATNDLTTSAPRFWARKLPGCTRYWHHMHTRFYNIFSRFAVHVLSKRTFSSKWYKLFITVMPISAPGIWNLRSWLTNDSKTLRIAASLSEVLLSDLVTLLSDLRNLNILLNRLSAVVAARLDDYFLVTNSSKGSWLPWYTLASSSKPRAEASRCCYCRILHFHDPWFLMQVLVQVYTQNHYCWHHCPCWHHYHHLLQRRCCSHWNTVVYHFLQRIST